MEQVKEKIINVVQSVENSTASTSNGTNGHANTTTTTTTSGLKILIVGAGIGGLTAAIALRQQGHDVEIFEQSRMTSELGAAIHLAPNAHGIMKRLGVFPEEFGSNTMLSLTEYTREGKLDRRIDLARPNSLWQHKWVLCHRVHLHNKLKQTAIDPTGKGNPATLHSASRVERVDAAKATITLKDGTTIQGDLILGADGVHSVTRDIVAGRHLPTHGSGKSAFRFLIKKQAALDDPLVAPYFQSEGDLTIWYGIDRRLVVYPTTNNTLLNFVCIHPENESDGGETWNKTASREQMLKIYEDFDPAMLALIKKADPETLKVWKLLDMETMETWVRDKLALLGDAAHPFTPHQGQGGGQAIEDAAALAVVLPRDTPKDEIRERLQLYEKIRKDRAHRIQEYSRVAGRDVKEGVKEDMQQYTVYNFGHDEWDNASQELRKWEWARKPNLYWRMPIAFGPMPGPRQSFHGAIRSAHDSTFTTASIKFKTSRTMLQNLFPHTSSTSYRFQNPGTVAYASISQTTLGNMEWLGGSGYNHLGLYIHGVEYVKRDGSVVRGTYMPLLFENLGDPIISGREELGMPKLYTAIDVHRRATSYRINTSWEGAVWGNFILSDLEEIDLASPSASASASISGEADDGIIVHRYIPAVGRDSRGRADADYAVFDPYKEELPVPQPKRAWKAGKASFKLDALDLDALPTMHHIIERLAELPVYEIMGGKIVEGTGVPDVAAARRIE